MVSTWYVIVFWLIIFGSIGVWALMYLSYLDFYDWKQDWSLSFYKWLRYYAQPQALIATTTSVFALLVLVIH